MVYTNYRIYSTYFLERGDCLSKSKSPKRFGNTASPSFSGLLPGNSSAHCWPSGGLRGCKRLSGACNAGPSGPATARACQLCWLAGLKPAKRWAFIFCSSPMWVQRKSAGCAFWPRRPLPPAVFSATTSKNRRSPHERDQAKTVFQTAPDGGGRPYPQGRHETGLAARQRKGPQAAGTARSAEQSIRRILPDGGTGGTHHRGFDRSDRGRRAARWPNAGTEGCTPAPGTCKSQQATGNPRTAGQFTCQKSRHRKAAPPFPAESRQDRAQHHPRGNRESPWNENRTGRRSGRQGRHSPDCPYDSTLPADGPAGC